ncbi:phosphoglycerate mutase-like protein [Annulohypoxylon maeteangense]|uniref:phosphoglycerate mutase-like protein n=1 Tax=Annulohypoxylon maeteangense TaxID=1927788 RepID=UPI002007A56D|nr:phosphoglycerate mutase-like protein [Annulohypoxylon maeteangense]KAI0885434.1 phosphoglycerate mutase-like protein [Annulohypoxylon maeteangense]
MKVMKYTNVPGFFLHDEEPEGPEFRATTFPDLGLIDRPYETDASFRSYCNSLPADQRAAIPKDKWARFEYFLKHLNKTGQGKAEWKLFFVVRHGEGFHNVKEKEVGRAEWERHWSRVDGDALHNWADARLTEYGRSQAASLSQVVSSDKPYRPQSVYSSPLARCLETTDIIFRKNMHDKYIQHAIVKENLRERFGVHTCDRRSRKSWITATFPWFTLEHGFSEKDELWESHRRETEEEVARRARSALDDIWKHDRNSHIAIAAHSGFIRALYAAIGHRAVWVAAGQMMPVFIKGEMVEV